MLRSASELKDNKVDIFYSNSLVPEKRIENGRETSDLSENNVSDKVLGVKKLCSMKVTLDESIYHQLPTEINPEGQERKRLSFDLELKISSGQLYWSAKRDGVDLGTATMNVTYEGMAA